MAENLRLKNIIKNPRTTLAVILCAGAGAIAGCGGNTKSAESISVGTCGSNDYSKAGEPSNLPTASEAISIAQKDASTLLQRALKSGGSIDLPRYDDTNAHTTEITASADKLTLNFARNTFPQGNTVDHIDFLFKDDVAQIDEGAVMCFDINGQLVVNGTYTTLQSYVHETSALDQ